MSNPKKIVLIVILVFLSLLVVGSVAYVGYDYYKSMELENGEGGENTEDEVADSEYEGWLDYENEEAGYGLKYPSDWTYEETIGISDITQFEVNYVEFTTPLGTVLHFGLKRDGVGGFKLTDRTGVGAGDDIEIPEKSGELFTSVITPMAHSWEGMVKEYFFSIEDEESCGCDHSLWFTMVDEITLDEAEENEELDVVNKVFASVYWLDEEDEEYLNLKKAIGAVENYMKARIDRDLEKARPYITDYLYSQLTQEEFAGASSPSIGKYSDTEAEYSEDGDLYLVTTYVYWYLQGEEVDTAEWDFQVVVEDGEFLINQVDMK